MNVPVAFSWMYRPPRIQVVSEVPPLSIGGWPGIIHAVTFVSHVPVMPSSILCPSLGVMYFIHAAIIACSSGEGGFGCF